MVVDGKKAAYGQLNYMDRLSDLPDSILHHIISFLGTKGACRTTILSKRWAHIWSTGLILEFSPRFFVPKKDGGSNRPYSEETVGRLINFIESTMRRYSEKNLSIRMFRLKYPTIDPNMNGRIDRWLGIALQNQVEKLLLSVIPKASPSYLLPVFFFLAKSLVSVTFFRVRVPYCKNLKLISLQYLDMTKVDVDEKTLQNIIISCPLKNLRLNRCSGLKNISIPCCSRLESLDISKSFPVGGIIAVDTSSLRFLEYEGCGYNNNTWLFTLKPGSLKSLRELKIVYVVIENYVFEQLVAELVSIERMNFFKCRLPEKTKVSSKTLKQLAIGSCVDLINVEIDAPELNLFSYTGDLGLSSVISSHGDADLHLFVKFDTQAFLKLRKLLIKAKRSKDLNVVVNDYSRKDEKIKSEQDQLSEIRDGMVSDVQELKQAIYNNIRPESPHIAALLDGLSWRCRPECLSMLITFDIDNITVKDFLEVLEEKVTRWKHLLQRSEHEGTTLFSSWMLDLRLRLSW